MTFIKGFFLDNFGPGFGPMYHNIVDRFYISSSEKTSSFSLMSSFDSSARHSRISFLFISA